MFSKSFDDHLEEAQTCELTSTINVLPVPDLDHADDQLIFLNSVDDNVLPLTNSVPISSGQLLRARRPGIASQPLDSFYDALAAAWSNEPESTSLDMSPAGQVCEHPIQQRDS